MTVSIITASFKCSNTIGDCIQSIVNQTYPYIEHIIIDGGSKDGTLEEKNLHIGIEMPAKITKKSGKNGTGRSIMEGSQKKF